MKRATIALTSPPVTPRTGALARWSAAAGVLLRDPTLGLGIISAVLFTAIFVAYPLLRVAWQGFFNPVTGTFSVEYFARYADPLYSRHQWDVVWNTLIMGLGAASGGTLLGFVFAYALTRCDMPFSRAFHLAALVPMVSPPFAIAIASILLFGRSGLVTRTVLGMRFGPGTNDLYGLDGLIFVQVITFFPVAYLIIRAMLERIDASMEEAALNMGASRLHVFRTITLPLLIPGLAGSFLLLFVESVADLGNPLLLAGNRSVLATEIYLAVNGTFDQHRGAAFSVVLLIPTLVVFFVQRYWVSRHSYISVTGKPTGGRIRETEPLIRVPVILITVAALLMTAALYGSIVLGSITRLWGIDYSLDFSHYQVALTRGLNPILATTFLSVVATPIAGLMGIVIAYLVVRKAFAGKEALDFISNLGAAVPGTILGIGYIVAFIKPPMELVILAFGLLSFYLTWSTWNASSPVKGSANALALTDNKSRRLPMLAAGLLLGGLLWWIAPLLEAGAWHGLLATVFIALGLFVARQGGRLPALLVATPGVYLLLGLLEPSLTTPLAVYGRTLGGNGAKLLTTLAEMIGVLFRVPPAFTGFGTLALGALAAQSGSISGRLRFLAGTLLMALAFVLVFNGQPLALVGTPYIVIAAYAVRSLPAAVRAGMAALQQIDPSIEEASINLGADTQTTFRKVTVPLIMPALLVGLIFAFARHMTSLSAIIFLTTPRWPILTVWILSEVEQGGLSTAAAYSVILVSIVLGAILLMYAFVGRRLRAQGGIDFTAMS